PPSAATVCFPRVSHFRVELAARLRLNDPHERPAPGPHGETHAPARTAAPPPRLRIVGAGRLAAGRGPAGGVPPARLGLGLGPLLAERAALAAAGPGRRRLVVPVLPPLVPVLAGPGAAWRPAAERRLPPLPGPVLAAQRAHLRRA